MTTTASSPTAGTMIEAKALADLLGLSVRQIENLVVEGMPHRKQRGKKTLFAAGECVRWYAIRRAKNEARKHGSEPQQSSRNRKLEAEARKAELEVAQLERQLVALDTFEVELSGILERIRARILAASQKWAPRLVGLHSIPEALAGLEPLIAELMVECTRVADEVDAGEHVPAEPHADAPRRRRRAP